MYDFSVLGFAKHPSYQNLPLHISTFVGETTLVSTIMTPFSSVNMQLSLWMTTGGSPWLGSGNGFAQEGSLGIEINLHGQEEVASRGMF